MNDFFEEINLKEVATDIYCTPFLSKEAVQVLYNTCINFDSWKSYTNEYATQDLIFREYYFAYYAVISSAFIQLRSNLEKLGWHLGEYYTSEIFAVKYTLDTQKSLKLHVDDSYITGSIKLNSNYFGGVLTFPRQKFSNMNVPVGNLLIWPSQITHPHFSSKLESGEKYSITIWSDSKKIS